MCKKGDCYCFSFKYMKKVFVLIYFIVIGFTVAKSQTNYSFRTINKDNGLVDNYVEQVYEDSRGFMWFATHGGISRFDGHSFKTFDLPREKRSDQPELAKSFVNSLIEDNNHNLWIGTLSGIFLYDLEKGRFTVFQNEFNDVKVLQHKYINEIKFDKSYNAWIATRFGLTFYNKQSKKCTHFFHNDKDPKSISNDYINSICVDYKGDTWIATREGGLNKLADDKKSFIHYIELNVGLDDINIRSLFEDSHKNLWALSAQKGLYCRYFGTNDFKKVPLMNSTNSEFQSLFVKVNEDVYGNIWVSTVTDGIVIYNPVTKVCKFINENTRSPQSICSNSVQNINRDSQGNMWLSTHGGGVSLFCPRNNWFAYYNKSQIPNSLPGNLVSCFCEDHNGYIWVGTDGNGFARFYKSTGYFETYSKANGLSSNAVLDICEIKDNLLAIATYAGGLNLFDEKTKTFKQYYYKPIRPDGNLQHIFGFYFEKATNLLWCCAFNDGIQIFNCTTMKFLEPNELLKICPYYQTPRFSMKMLVDKDNNRWIAEGIQFYRYHENKGSKNNRSDSLRKIRSESFVMDMLLDSKGTFWVNTTKGVIRYDRKNDTFKLFEMPNVDLKDANGLLEDYRANIWIATSRFLYRYNQKQNHIENISLDWGIPEMQYFKKSTMRSHDGFLYFGGLKGFIVLDEKAKNDTVKPSLYLTKLFINDVEQTTSTEGSVVKKDISFLSNITLPYDRNYITIEFASMNFIDNEKSKFKYLLKGFNDTWIETSNDRQAQFTGIPPGNYTFFLKTTDSNGNWIDKPISLHITILPPWWKTIWFRIFLTALLLFAIWKIIKLREENIKRKNRQLEELVAKRTQELKSINQDLQLQKSTIEKQYYDIKENHFVIKLKNTQLQDALEMKDKLLTVIAHDFKNPLSALQGILKVIQRKTIENGYDQIKKNVDSVVNSSGRLMDQMLGILDWSLGNDKTIIHIPIDTNIENILADVLSLVNESALRKGIAIKIKNNCRSAAFVDSRMISAVIRNLVSNSIKYTNDNGKIWIRIAETEKEVVFEIEDNGIGMEQSLIDKILQSDELQGNDFHSGFGLMICKTFVKRNKGTLQIESKINKGSTFRILMPKGQLLQTNESESPIEISDQSFEIENAEMSMLIIDDNKDIIGYLNEEFSDSYTVYGANGGKKGLQIAHNVIPDIILCDVDMPSIDGLTFCKMIKSDSLTSHIPVILVSAKSLQTDQIEGLKSGADDYITKPFDVNILRQKVAAIIKNRKILNQLYKSNTVLVEKPELPESYNDKIIAEATAMILANFRNVEFSVDYLAKQLLLSRSQLYRKFVAVLGQTPKEYILTLKFEKAVEMLKTKKYRIGDIAFELGFTDAHYFSLSFTQRFGVAPSNYFPKESE